MTVTLRYNYNYLIDAVDSLFYYAFEDQYDISRIQTEKALTFMLYK